MKLLTPVPFALALAVGCALLPAARAQAPPAGEFARVLGFTSVEAALSALAGSNEARAERAVDYLAVRPKESVPRLIGAVRDPNRIIALASRAAVRGTFTEADARLIEAARRAREDRAAPRVLRALAKSDDPDALRFLNRLLRNNFYEKQPGGERIQFGDGTYGGCVPRQNSFGVAIVKALGEVPDPVRVAGVLEQAAREGDEAVRATALRVLGRHASASVAHGGSVHEEVEDAESGPL